MHDASFTPNTAKARSFAQELAELGNLWERDTHGLGPVAQAYLDRPALGLPIAAGLVVSGAVLFGGWATTLVAAIRPFAEVPRSLAIILCSFATVAVTALLRLLATTMRECLWMRKIRVQYNQSEHALREEYGAASVATSAATPWR